MWAIIGNYAGNLSFVIFLASSYPLTAFQWFLQFFWWAIIGNFVVNHSFVIFLASNNHLTAFQWFLQFFRWAIIGNFAGKIVLCHFYNFSGGR